MLDACSGYTNAGTKTRGDFFGEAELLRGALLVFIRALTRVDRVTEQLQKLIGLKNRDNIMGL